MLKKEVIKKMAATLKIKEEDLTAALTDEKEVDLALPDDLTVFTAAELQTLKNNEYSRGKEVGPEMAVKELKKEMGLEFQGTSLKALIESFAAKKLEEAKIEPDKKVSELQKELENVRKTASTLEQQIKEKDSQVEQIRTTTELYKHIPAPPKDGPAIGQDDVIQLMRAGGYDFKLEEGKLVAYKGGEKVLDNLSRPVAAGDVVSSFIKEKRLFPEAAPAGGGRGAGNQAPPASFTKLSEIKADFERQGKSLLGQEFQQAVSAAMAANESFDMNS